MGGTIMVRGAFVTLWVVLSPTIAFSDDVFNISVVRDLKVGHFQRAYQGKAFSDTGTVDVYANRLNGSPYVQVKKDDNQVFCELEQSTYDRYRMTHPEGTSVRITGVMEEWYLTDQTLLLKRQCQLNGPSVPNSFDMRVVTDLKSGYFDKTYKGKSFSNAGTVEAYLQRIIPGLVGISVWYVQMKAGAERVWCVISEAAKNSFQRDFPPGTAIRMAGKMESWWLNDQTLKLEDNCAVGRS
jgi:hypothetical protein